MRGRFRLAGAELVGGRSNGLDLLPERPALGTGIQMGAFRAGEWSIGSLGEGLGEPGALRGVHCFRLLDGLGSRWARDAMRSCDVDCCEVRCCEIHCCEIRWRDI